MPERPYAEPMGTQELLTVAQVAKRLGVDETAALLQIRTGMPGAIRKNDGTFLVPATALEEAAKTRRPGAGSKVSLDAQAQAELVAEAHAAGAQIEEARAAMAEGAARKQAAILRLSEGGLTVRQIGVLLGVSHTVVQTALTEARKRT